MGHQDSLSPREFLTQTDLKDTFVVGYYGGGNFGDELLLEVILFTLQEKKEEGVSFYYSDQVDYNTYHRDFGFEKVSVRKKLALMKNLFLKKNIIIGGGGLWGLDTNFRTFVLFCIVFVSHVVFRTKIYAIGVGYYSSTNRLGRIGAWLVGKVATMIIVRDQESFENFSQFSQRVTLSDDIAEELAQRQNTLSLYAPEKNDFPQITGPVKLIFHREMRGQKKIAYVKYLKNELAKEDQNCLLIMCDGKDVFPELYAEIRSLAITYDTPFFHLEKNPITFFEFLRANREHIKIIAPQFHVILLAIILKIPFLPISYDNKVTELYSKHSISSIILLEQLTVKDQI